MKKFSIVILTFGVAAAFFGLTACGDNSNSQSTSIDSEQPISEEISSSSEANSSESLEERSSESKEVEKDINQSSSSTTKSSSSEARSSSNDIAESSSESAPTKDAFIITEKEGKKTLIVNDVTTIAKVLDTLSVEGSLTLILQDDSLTTTNENQRWETFANGARWNNGYDIELELNVSIKDIPKYGPCSVKDNNSFIKITLPDDINATPANFYGCKNLKEIVTIPANSDNHVIKSIDGILYNADMTKIIIYPPQKEGETFTISEGITDIAYAFHDNKYLRHVEFPNSLEKIGPRAFFNTIIDSIVIPSTVKIIGNAAFFAALHYVELNEGLEIIDEDAFNCSSIETVTIPSTVTQIGEAAFANNAKLKEMHLKSETPCKAASNTLTFSNNATVYVPKGTSRIYSISQGWYEMRIPFTEEEN